MSADVNHARRYGLGPAIAVFLALRGLTLLVAYTAPQDRDRPNSPEWWSHVPTMRWDAGHYSAILQSGYPRRNGQLPSWPSSDTIAFFPLFPLVSRPLMKWFHPEMALVVSAHLFASLAAVFLYLWARRRYHPRAAFWCVLMLSAYPSAMFFSAGYADALLVLCVALTLWLLDSGRVWAAAVACGLASATRPTGVALSAVFGLWALTHLPRLSWPRQAARLAGLALLSVSGLILFQLYLWQYYGRPDAFAAVQSNWGSRKSVPDPLVRILTLKPIIQPAFAPFKYALRGDFERFTTSYRWNPLLNLIMVGLGVAGLIRPGAIPRVFFLLPLLVLLMAWLPDPYRGGRMEGISRYQLMALPCFLLLAAWMLRWPAWLRFAGCAAWLGLQCMFVRDFANWQLVS